MHLLTSLKALLMFVLKIFERVKEHNFVKLDDRKEIVKPDFIKKWIPSGIVSGEFLRNQMRTYS